MKFFHPALIFFCILTAGCATYQSKIQESRSFIRAGKIDSALTQLKALAEKPGDDQLVYLLDYGTVLQIAGQYKESNNIFLKADQLTDINDYHSVSNIVSATLGGEEMVQYKGESYEKYLINTMLAINYLMLGQQDDALVEARRINEKIQKMKMDGREPYELSPFAKYFSALVWESDQKWDDAYIAYEQTYKIDSKNPFLPKDLVRSAKKAQRQETYQKWKNEFPHIEEDHKWYDKSLGELVVIFQQGWGPEKQIRPGNYRFPILSPSRANTRSAKVYINGEEKGLTQLIYDVEKMCIKTLEADFGALVARRVGGIAAKAIVADQVRQKNKLLGDLTWIAMNLADRADLRQWSTLPQTIQLAKIYLSPGTYKLKLQGFDSYGGPSMDFLGEVEIKINSGKKTFINWRSLH